MILCPVCGTVPEIRPTSDAWLRCLCGALISKVRGTQWRFGFTDRNVLVMVQGPTVYRSFPDKVVPATVEDVAEAIREVVVGHVLDS